MYIRYGLSSVRYSSFVNLLLIFLDNYIPLSAQFSTLLPLLNKNYRFTGIKCRILAQNPQYSLAQLLLSFIKIAHIRLIFNKLLRLSRLYEKLWDKNVPYVSTIHFFVKFTRFSMFLKKQFKIIHNCDVNPKVGQNVKLWVCTSLPPDF